MDEERERRRQRQAFKGIGYSGPSLRNEILENIAATFPQTNLIRRAIC